MERMWKSLWAVLEDHHKQLSLVNKVHLLHDVACGLKYLHSKKPPIVHRSLSANDIWLSENLTAKIGDLEQARILELVNDKEQLLSFPGNPIYIHLPPEALVHKPVYDSSLDIFSFGCVVIHTVTEKLPIPTDQYVQSGNSGMFVKQPEIQRRQQYLDVMNDYSKLQTVSIQCLADTPKNRPNASHICDSLLQYIEQLETKFPVLTKQHKLSKLSLIHFNEERNEEIRTKCKKLTSEKDECISILEQQLLNDTRDKTKQNKEVSEKEKDSLKMELAEMIRESSRIYQEEVDRLREELKASSVTHTQLQEQRIDVQEKLNFEEFSHQQKVMDLQTKIKLTEDTNQMEQSTFSDTEVRNC